MTTSEQEKVVAKELAAAKAALQAALAAAKAAHFGDVVGETADTVAQVEYLQRTVS